MFCESGVAARSAPANAKLCVVKLNSACRRVGNGFSSWSGLYRKTRGVNQISKGYQC